jgi:myo-inositol-1(or 4)-monophosphatase
MKSRMSPQSATEYLDFARRAAQAAGEAILPYFRTAITVDDKRNAQGYDPVTEADRAAEAVIRKAIIARYPTHGVLGEEQGSLAGTSPFVWVIDPIDGTKSFILGQLHWATLIALHDGTRPIVGVAHQPFVGETFSGSAGGVAHWQRGTEQRQLHTRRCARIEDAIVVTTDPRHFSDPRRLSAFEAVTANARLTRYGGDCYCYTQLAMGLTDVVIETGLQPYDIQALIPIIEAAGGVVTDWQGGPCDQGGDALACGDARLHALLLERIARAGR